MEASAAVKGFDEIKDGLACLGSGFEVAAIDEFMFESAPEGFHGGIVVAVAFRCWVRAEVGGQLGRDRPRGVDARSVDSPKRDGWFGGDRGG
jgi:hypothetical protein